MKTAEDSKSRLKAKALEYFRQVETTRQPLVVTERGRAVLRLEPYRPPDPKIVLDTHVWVWWVSGSVRLSALPS